VGFIQKLPTALVAAFRATLEEITDADLLLHVVDITHPNAEQQAATVMQVLQDLNATEQPVITALNKIDMLPDPDDLSGSMADLPDGSVALSALTGQGLPDLLGLIEEVLTEELVGVEVLLPYSRGDLAALMHQRGVVDREDHTADGTVMAGRIPADLFARFESFLTSSDE
jgi:GTP-binding protein HflX